MKVELAEMQQKLAASSHGSAEVQEDQKQAEAKVAAAAVKRQQRQEDAEETVCRIAKALQQHAISTGDQQPTPAPAAVGVEDLAPAGATAQWCGHGVSAARRIF